jgi:hypothetical protein
MLIIHLIQRLYALSLIVNYFCEKTTIIIQTNILLGFIADCRSNYIPFRCVVRISVISLRSCRMMLIRTSRMANVISGATFMRELTILLRLCNRAINPLRLLQKSCNHDVAANFSLRVFFIFIGALQTQAKACGYQNRTFARASLFNPLTPNIFRNSLSPMIFVIGRRSSFCHNIFKAVLDPLHYNKI